MSPAALRRLKLYGVFAACLAVGAWALVRGVPAWKRAAELQRDATGLDATEATSVSTADLVALSGQVDDLQAQLAEQEHAPTATPPPVQLDLTLANLAEREGLEVVTLEARRPGSHQSAYSSRRDDDDGDDGYALPTASRRGAMAVGRRVALHGTFASMQRFLTAVAELPSPPNVGQLSVTRSDERLPLRIELELAP